MRRGGGAAALAAVLLLGAGALWRGTDGLAAFTAEGARRLDVARSPRPLPAVALQDQTGARFAFADLEGKIVLLDFVYTRCPTVCTVLGSEFERMRERIGHSDLAGHVALLTISFDPAYDGPEELSGYADRFGGADDVWRFVRAPSMAETRALMRAAAVIAVPDGFGGFVHNAAIHVVDRRGRLVRILDSDATDAALALAHDLL